ncbi:hypothetical protein ACH4KL_16255 [Streptomyces albus]|uniref:hypothetical protein n=2 Tax=Streptomyces albus TaxID=1888 RepID=UPI0024E0AE13|nr:hypothetical protein [Streptomyces albus]GHJ21652.1 hypothetical protein TPA0909_32660 [Streptomyces albus]
MARMSRSEMAREADKADEVAVGFEAAAREAREWAASSGDVLAREQGAAMVRLHRENAAEYRNAAELLRDGEMPEGW